MTAHPVIRAYSPSDEPQVVGLWKRVFAGDPPWNEPSDVIRRKRGVQPEWFFVGVAGERVVGTVMAGYDGTRGWIHHLAVEPDFRRQGCASSLVAAAESALGAVGCPKLNLQVRAENESAMAFYRKLGFAVEERVSFGKRLGRWADD